MKIRGRNQYKVWKEQKKCLNLQKKFGDYDDFELNSSGNGIIANRQCVYFCTKDILNEGDYTLLEVGPGPGHFLWALKDNAKELHGLEYSVHMIDLCNEQFKKTDKPVNLTQGTCWSLPYVDKSFDVSLQCDVCRHIAGNWTSLLEQIRVSRKYVIFSGPSFERWGLDAPAEKELERLMFGINLDIFEKRLNDMKKNGDIVDFYYKKRPNKRDRIKRRILIIKCG